MPWYYYVGRVIVRMLFILLTRLRVKGRENVPSEGAVLIVANHLNNVDPPLLGVSLGRRVMFMAKKELFHSRLSSCFMHGIGAFPVHRGQMDKKALRRADEVLAEGLALVMFPEGMRSQSAQLQTAFPGSALIASRSSVSILPVGITGTERIKGVAWILRRPRVTVNIGHPFNPPPVGSKLTKVELAKFTDSIMERIAELLPLEYRGNYAGRGN